MKKLFAISGTLRAGSSNHTILEYLGSQVPDDINYMVYNGLADIPAFDPGLDNDDPPTSVIYLRKQLAEADGIIICTPEYAFGVPGALKNALDCTVSSGSFSDKPTALITASTGGENAHEAMIKILGAIDAKIIPETTLLIQFIRTRITNRQIESETKKKFDVVLNTLINAIMH